MAYPVGPQARVDLLVEPRDGLEGLDPHARLGLFKVVGLDEEEDTCWDGYNSIKEKVI